MSGFEIVGVILGSLPLVIEGCKIASPYLERTAFWFKFRTSFPDMLKDLEEALYQSRQNVKWLLAPLSLDGQTLEHILKDVAPANGSWCDPEFQGRLRERLGHSDFVFLLSKFERVWEIVQVLRGLLVPIEDGKVRSFFLF